MSLVYFRFSDGLADIVGGRNSFVSSFYQLPFADLGWASGDLIAGLTVGIVLVPQSMSYAQVRFLF